MVGTTLAGYTLRDLIGEGGTSTVFRAEHPQYGVCAVKVLREKLRDDKTAIARFVREAKYGTRVTHPNVVRTIEIGEARPGLHFLAIEWASGELLERYAKRHAPLPLNDVADMILQIAGAVQAAHAAGIVHRDLKPDNVMYDPETRRVLLLDFGIAADTDTGAEDRLTRAGFFVGTLLYVAPEALSGEMVTPAADQYSLATIAYYLLTGTHPFVAKSPREMFTQLLTQPPIALNAAKPGLTFSAAVSDVIMKGLRPPGFLKVLDSTTIGFAEALSAAATAAPTTRRAVANPAAGVFAKVKGLFGKG